MPIYEYRCLECGDTSEMLLRSGNESIECPSCGSKNLQKVFSASYNIRMSASMPGRTCCGRARRRLATFCSGESCNEPHKRHVSYGR
ncbi:hypothetical protein ES703_77270 [subsurface metagenome]